MVKKSFSELVNEKIGQWMQTMEYDLRKIIRDEEN